jgi:O-antigen/teichoic acid export membrane protein
MTGPLVTDATESPETRKSADVTSRSVAAGPSGAAAHVARRLGWGVVDQGVSSLGNFAMGLLVARSLGSELFGAFTLAYVTYGVVLNASRGLATDPLLVRHSGAPTPEWRRAVSAATATGWLVGMVAGSVCVVVGLVLPRPVGWGFVALGVTLPGLMVQDAWRFAFFSVGRPVKAVVNDGVWTLLQLVILGALFATDTASVATCVLAFGGAGLASAALGLVQTGIRPRLASAPGFVRANLDLGGRYLVENVAISGARQVRFVLLGGIVSLGAVGDVRAAEMLMGPFLVILMGMSQVAVPEAAQVLRTAPQRLGRFCLAFGSLQALAAALWGGVMLILLPLHLGDVLLESLWHPAASLLPLVIAGMIAGGFEVGAAAGVRALGAARRSLRAQLTFSFLYLVGGTLGAWLDGARGTCLGVAIATAIGAMVWWYQLQRARAEYAVAHTVAAP